MVTITTDLIKKVAPRFKDAETYVKLMNEQFPKYGITTPERAAMFLAQLLHETGGGYYWKEIWGPTPAQVRYEGRKDLGNIVKGDGVKFKGRGGFQCTGRANYTAYKAYSGVDVVSHPEFLEQPKYALDVSLWYWKKNALQAYADKEDVKGCTKRINGGYNGLAERQAYYDKLIHLIH